MARRIASGLQAVTQAIAMPTLFAVRDEAQTIYLPPGSYDRRQRLYILGNLSGNVYYLHDDGLWEMPRRDFLAAYVQGQMAIRIYDRTRWFIPVGEAIAAFSMSFGLAAAGPLGIGLSVVLVAIKLSVFYETHRRQVDVAIAHLGVSVRALHYIRDHCPITYAQLRRLVAPAAWSALASVPQGINASDIAALLGRLLGGLSSVPQLGLGQLVRILGGVVTTFATRLPGMAGRGVAENARAAADSFIRAFPPDMQNLDLPGLYAEFARHPELVDKLRELENSLRQAAPVLQALATAFQSEAVPELRR
jgi:hypothetical protein